MIFDHLSMCLTVASLILGLLTIVIVGSQTRVDARSVVTWTLSVLVPMLLVSCASIALTHRQGGMDGGPGMLALCSALNAAVLLGYRIAAVRHTTSKDTSKGKKVGPGSWDDDLA